MMFLTEKIKNIQKKKKKKYPGLTRYDGITAGSKVSNLNG